MIRLAAACIVALATVPAFGGDLAPRCTLKTDADCRRMASEYRSARMAGLRAKQATCCTEGDKIRAQVRAEFKFIRAAKRRLPKRIHGELKRVYACIEQDAAFDAGQTVDPKYVQICRGHLAD